MYNSSNAPLAADPLTDSERLASQTQDLQTALSLARASTLALLSLSPLAHREITAALMDEVLQLKGRGDTGSLTTATALERYLSKAA